MAALDHIGIAINDLPQMTKLFGLLNLNVNQSEPVPEQGVVTHFLPLLPAAGGTPALELLEPTDPEGTIALFMKKKGPGIHHLAFSVGQGDLDGLSQRLRSEGFRLIYETARAGAHGKRVNFIHPASAGGILIELTEPT